MDYKTELQNEYASWNDKKVKRKHRVIQVKNYTTEQIYHQIQSITEIATKKVEAYLVEYMNRENAVSEDESISESNEEDEVSGQDGQEEEENQEEDNDESNGEDEEVSSEEDEEMSNELANEEEDCTQDEVEDENLEDEDEVSEENLEDDVDVEDINDISSGAEYNSEELNDIYNYLENDDEAAELLTETAEETLRKLRK
ncbi:hypothetical protein NEMIN01_1535 [Nematocida minor]|uniref:uncharacterized protein n=1 Tax=Nematocida minor TaxID=1912983 RepID=UPI00221F76FE|nr:uncharacterized protein NEMIN01_1535 [Nematocida minor]KAI5191509.1 hypothetical protein NEMIN01_1535 [Nematocida minor]